MWFITPMKKKLPNNLCVSKKHRTFAPDFARNRKNGDSLAQLVEHNTFNVGVLGSSPKRITNETRRKLATVACGFFRASNASLASSCQAFSLIRAKFIFKA